MPNHRSGVNMVLLFTPDRECHHGTTFTDTDLLTSLCSSSM